MYAKGAPGQEADIKAQDSQEAIGPVPPTRRRPSNMKTAGTRSTST